MVVKPAVPAAQIKPKSPEFKDLDVGELFDYAGDPENIYLKTTSTMAFRLSDHLTATDSIVGGKYASEIRRRSGFIQMEN